MRTSHAIIIALLGSSAIANADPTTVTALVSGDVAATDNVFASTRDTNEGDLFMTVRPGVLLGYNRPRMIQNLSLEAEILEYLLHSDKPSISLRAAWQASYITGKYSSLQTSVNASNGVLTAISARSSPDQSVVQVTPIGAVDTQNGDGSEFFSWQFAENWRFAQTLFGRASRTDDNAMDPTKTNAAEAGLAFGLERTFRDNSLSLEVAASALRLQLIAPAGAIQPSRLDHQLNPRARAQWRHDYGRRWSSTLDGGVVFVRPFGTDPDNPDAKPANGTFPIAAAAVAYSDVWGRAQLAVRREVTPNLFIAQNTVSDSITASMVMPLPWLDDSSRRSPKLVGLGSAGLARTQLVASDTGKLASAFTAAQLDVGVAYTPRPGFTYGVRYEFIYQTGDAQAVMLIPGFFRNTLFFTFAIRYPDNVVERVPKRRTNSVRADGKDLVPIGVDPNAPDMEKQAGDESEGTGGTDNSSGDE